MYQALFEPQLEENVLIEIGFSINKGLSMGSERFKQEIKGLTGWRLMPLKHGRKCKLTEVD